VKLRHVYVVNTFCAIVCEYAHTNI